jgi:2-dehydropantoate 2-reductase
MKITVIGAGAVGGLFAAKLTNIGHDVTIVDRDQQLAAIERNGLTLIEPNGRRINAKVRTITRIAEIGAQDIIILAVKAHQLADVAVELVLGNGETVVTVQNGIPWWYFFKHGGPYEQRRLESVDPGNIIADHVAIEHVVASVVYPAAEVVSPGVVRLIEGKRISVAELDGAKTSRIKRLSTALREAGFKAPIVSDIRAEIWTKLWGNLSFNPISALTHATLAEICSYPPGRRLLADLMDEMQNVVEALGIRLPISREQRIAAAEAIGAHKTSMLQDIERGRIPEADAVIGSVSEVGRLVGIKTPKVDALHALVKLLATTLSERNGRLRVEVSPPPS